MRRTFLAIFSILLIIAMVFLSNRYLSDYSIYGVSVAALLNGPFAVWIAYFLITLFTNNKNLYKAFLGATAGIILSVFLNMSVLHWEQSALKIIVILIGALPLWGVVKRHTKIS